MSKLKNSLKSAFTLLELIVVLAIAAVLLTLTVTGFNYMRDSIAVSNTTEGLKAAIRDAQDKALTYSVSSNNDGTVEPPFWVYGYSFEYDSVNNKYVLYTISDTLINISTTTDSLFSTTLKTKSTNIKSNWKTTTDRCGTGITGLEANIVCTPVKDYELKTSVFTGMSPCQLLFTTVNSTATVKGGASNNCGIQFKEPYKSQTLCFSPGGVSEIKIYDGTDITTCP